MRKKEKKQRDIKYKSDKNDSIVLVHSQDARTFAKTLESNKKVKQYTAGKEIDPLRMQMIQKTGIRSEYFKILWETDFYILYKDGSVAVREIATEQELERLPEIEKLELSRRFWQFCGVRDWKIVIVGGKSCS